MHFRRPIEGLALPGEPGYFHHANDDPYDVRLSKHIKACHDGKVDTNCIACKELQQKLDAQKQ